MQAIGAKACYFRKLHGSVSFEGFQLHFYLLCRENSILARCVFWIPFHCKGNVDFNKLNMLMGILSKNVVWFAQLERNLLTIWQVTLSEHFCLNLGIRPPHSQTRRLTKQKQNKNKTKTKQNKNKKKIKVQKLDTETSLENIEATQRNEAKRNKKNPPFSLIVT